MTKVSRERSGSLRSGWGTHATITSQLKKLGLPNADSEKSKRDRVNEAAEGIGNEQVPELLTLLGQERDPLRSKRLPFFLRSALPFQACRYIATVRGEGRRHSCR